MAEKKETFLESHKKSLEVAFWDETYLSVIIQSIEMTYSTAVLKEWGISNIVINGDKVLVKWYRRFRPLEPDQLKEKYGRSK